MRLRLAITIEHGPAEVHVTVGRGRPIYVLSILVPGIINANLRVERAVKLAIAQIERR